MSLDYGPFLTKWWSGFVSKFTEFTKSDKNFESSEISFSRARPLERKLNCDLRDPGVRLFLEIFFDGQWYVLLKCNGASKLEKNIALDGLDGKEDLIIDYFVEFKRDVCHFYNSSTTYTTERETEEINRRKKGLYMSQWFPNFLQVFKDTVEHTTLNTENSEPEQAKIWIICSLEILSVKLSLKICFDSQWCVFFACMHEDKHEKFLSFKTLDGQEKTIAENFRKYSTEMYDFFSVEGVSIKGNNTGILDILNEINALLRKAMDRVARSR